MKIIKENVIAGLKILTASLAFMIFLMAGAIVGAKPMTLFGGALLAYALFFLIGSILANILEQLVRETTVEQLEEKPRHERDVMSHIDLRQDEIIPNLAGRMGR